MIPQRWIGCVHPGALELNIGAHFGELIFESKPTDPTTTVGCDTTWSKACTETPIDLRMPTGLTGATNTDASAAVYEGATETLHEFYRFYTNSGKATQQAPT